MIELGLRLLRIIIWMRKAMVMKMIMEEMGRVKVKKKVGCLYGIQ